MSSLNWFITGVSSGLGFALAQHALAQGHHVVGTVRSRTKAAENIKALETSGAKLLTLDVSQLKDIPQAVHDAEDAYGHIDVIVNNAAYVILGPVEDTSDEEAQQQLQTNLLGPLSIIRSALPGMRKRKSGTIINISSSVTQDAFAATGLYTASKSALEGLADALARETGALGIRSIIVVPGAMRTSALDPGSMTTPARYTDAYDATPAKAVIEAMQASPGKQPGDPGRAAERMFEVVTGTGMGEELRGKGGDGTALRVLLGSDCYAALERQRKALDDVSRYTRRVAESTDF